ncbi:MAG TPA: OmpA family protein [Candidatus Saccharimonadales bacterium]|nr:OmpA family protein [Candidatus Saccharimonadales bacterium]
MKKRAGGEEHENSERWLLTYSDLITLLLAFFIVMYSMSQVDAKKFGAVTSALRRILSGGGLMLKGDQGMIVAPEVAAVPTESQDLKLVMASLEQDLRSAMGAGRVRLKQDARGVVISLSEKVLFESGQADLGPQAQAMLDTIAALLAQYPNEVRVEGHTDNVPIHSARFASNWELSAARATSVVRYLIESHRMSPLQLSAAGYGEYRPELPNATPTGRARNRRVDFVILAARPLPTGDAAELPAQTGATHGR